MEKNNFCRECHEAIWLCECEEIDRDEETKEINFDEVTNDLDDEFGIFEEYN